jgi:hypothetical protein
VGEEGKEGSEMKAVFMVVAFAALLTSALCARFNPVKVGKIG